MGHGQPAKLSIKIIQKIRAVNANPQDGVSYFLFRRSRSSTQPLVSLLRGQIMREIIRANDPVALSWARQLLEAEGINVVLFDAYMSGLEGAIGAFPRRLMVEAADEERARALIAAAGHRHLLFTSQPL
jgi:Putative prokaryotic signal transducing protein